MGRCSSTGCFLYRLVLFWNITVLTKSFDKSFLSYSFVLGGHEYLTCNEPDKLKTKEDEFHTKAASKGVYVYTINKTYYFLSKWFFFLTYDDVIVKYWFCCEVLWHK